jgi:la-related protein 1
MYGPSPPALPQGGFYYPPPGPFQLESTSSEFAPQGDAVKSEPSEALLHQIEFYFSHRNLEGDFYLRKNMDSQGFVPIQIVANFNKVKKMTDKIDVVKETLLFSKVLSVDVERDMVRKAIDWHLYILIDGERPQQNMYQQHPFHLPNRPMPPPPLPHFGQPLPPFAHTSPPFPPAHYGQPGPPFYFSSIHNHPAAPKLPSGAGQEPLHRPADSPDGHHSNGEASGDNIFGVIAAEGLAALP